EYVGVVVDIVHLGVLKKFRKKPKLRIVWMLDRNDSEGRPFRVTQLVTVSMNYRAPLLRIVTDILGETPSAQFDLETLIGLSRRLYLMTEKMAHGNLCSEIRAILPLSAGQQPMTVPTGFVRVKDRPTAACVR